MSGSVTLGGFAKNWRISRVGYAYAIQLGKMLQPERQFENDNEVPYLKSQHVQAGVVVSEDLPLMWANLAETSKYSVRDGDLLVCEGGDVGRAAIAVHVPEDTIIQNALHRVRSSGGNSLTYLLYVLLHIKNHGWFDIICNKSTIAHLTREKLSALAIPLPPPLVQRSIAAHLDRETAKVDTLIGKKRELIAKLKEQRSALISRTVTRGLPPEAAKAAGLDPNPPMKDSGVEWFGKVPEHWQISCLKRNWNVLDCKHLTAEFVDDGFPLASIREVQSRFVDLTNAKRTTPDFYFQLIEGDREPRLHDLIFSRNATVGEVAQVPVDQGNFALGQDVCLIRRKHASHSADFLQIVLRSEACRSQLDNVMVGSTFKRVNVEDIKALWIPVPPVNEQLAVANFLLSQLEKVDGLVTTVETAITRLTEYRAALITAAVTGQLNITSAG